MVAVEDVRAALSSLYTPFLFYSVHCVVHRRPDLSLGSILYSVEAIQLPNHDKVDDHRLPTSLSGGPIYRWRPVSQSV